jgi:hypothetical protein
MVEPEKIDRSPPLALFNLAESYWQAARALHTATMHTTHPGSPIAFLQYHAIELYLKSFLRHHGHTIKELASRKFGHKTCCLAERATKLGVEFDDEDNVVISMMSTTDAIIRSRYIETGYFSWPSYGALDRTCVSMRDLFGKRMAKDGVLIQLHRYPLASLD